MTPHKAQIQALIDEINNVLSKPSSRLPFGMSGEAEQQRQVLEQARRYLDSLQREMAEPGSFDSPARLPDSPLSYNLPYPPGQSPAVESAQQVLQAVLQEMTYLRSNVMQPLRSDVEQLQQQREALLQEVRSLEAQRQQYALPPAQINQQQIITEFLQSLMGRLQENLTGQVAQMVANLEAQSEQERAALGGTSSNLPLISGSDQSVLSPQQRLDQLQALQSQSDQLLLRLDSTLRVIFESLQSNIQSYQESLSQGLDKMHSLGQQGEAMFAALVNRLAQQLGREASTYLQSSIQTGDWEATGRLPATVTPQITERSPFILDTTSDIGAQEEISEAQIDLLLNELQADEPATTIQPPITSIQAADDPVEANLEADLEADLQALDLAMELPPAIATGSAETADSAQVEGLQMDEDITFFQVDQPLTSFQLDDEDMAQLQADLDAAVESVEADFLVEPDLEDADSTLDLLNQLSVELQSDAALAGNSENELAGAIAPPPEASEPDEMAELYQSLFGSAAIDGEDWSEAEPPIDQHVADAQMSETQMSETQMPEAQMSLEETPFDSTFDPLESQPLPEQELSDQNSSDQDFIDQHDQNLTDQAFADEPFDPIAVDPPDESLVEALFDGLADPAAALTTETSAIDPMMAAEEPFSELLGEPFPESELVGDSASGWQDEAIAPDVPPDVEVITSLSDLIIPPAGQAQDTSSTEEITSTLSQELHSDSLASPEDDAFVPAAANEVLLVSEDDLSTDAPVDLRFNADTLSQLTRDLSNLESRDDNLPGSEVLDSEIFDSEMPDLEMSEPDLSFLLDQANFLDDADDALVDSSNPDSSDPDSFNPELSDADSSDADLSNAALLEVNPSDEDDPDEDDPDEGDRLYALELGELLQQSPLPDLTYDSVYDLSFTEELQQPVDLFDELLVEEEVTDDADPLNELDNLFSTSDPTNLPSNVQPADLEPSIELQNWLTTLANTPDPLTSTEQVADATADSSNRLADDLTDEDLLNNLFSEERSPVNPEAIDAAPLSEASEDEAVEATGREDSPSELSQSSELSESSLSSLPPELFDELFAVELANLPTTSPTAEVDAVPDDTAPIENASAALEQSEFEQSEFEQPDLEQPDLEQPGDRPDLGALELPPAQSTSEPHSTSTPLPPSAALLATDTASPSVAVPLEDDATLDDVFAAVPLLPTPVEDELTAPAASIPDTPFLDDLFADETPIDVAAVDLPLRVSPGLKTLSTSSTQLSTPSTQESGLADAASGSDVPIEPSQNDDDTNAFTLEGLAESLFEDVPPLDSMTSSTITSFASFQPESEDWPLEGAFEDLGQAPPLPPSFEETGLLPLDQSVEAEIEKKKTLISDEAAIETPVEAIAPLDSNPLDLDATPTDTTDIAAITEAELSGDLDTLSTLANLDSANALDRDELDLIATVQPSETSLLELDALNELGYEPAEESNHEADLSEEFAETELNQLSALEALTTTDDLDDLGDAAIASDLTSDLDEEPDLDEESTLSLEPVSLDSTAIEPELPASELTDLNVAEPDPVSTQEPAIEVIADPTERVALEPASSEIANPEFVTSVHDPLDHGESPSSADLDLEPLDEDLDLEEFGLDEFDLEDEIEQTTFWKRSPTQDLRTADLQPADLLGLSEDLGIDAQELKALLETDFATEEFSPPPVYPRPDASAKVWYLGIDFGTSGISAVLVNRASLELYPIYWSIASQTGGEAEKRLRLPSLVYLSTVDRPSATSDFAMDLMTQSNRVRVTFPTAHQQSETTLPTATPQRLLRDFKPYLTVGIPHYSPETTQWEPVLQWSNQPLSLSAIHQAVRSLLSTLSVPDDDVDPALPTCAAVGLSETAFHAALRQLAGVTVGCPVGWVDTYGFNLREAILGARLVSRPDQIFVVEDAIATLLSALPSADGRSLTLPAGVAQNPEMHNMDWQGSTLVINAGAIATDLALVRLPQNLQTLTHQDFHLQSLPYAGNALDQDIICHLIYPAWLQRLASSNSPGSRQISDLPDDKLNYTFASGNGTKSGTFVDGWNWQPADTGSSGEQIWHTLGLENLSLPLVGEPDVQNRFVLQQRLSSTPLGQGLLEAARHLKLTLQHQDRFVLRLGDQQLTIARQDLGSLIFLPYVQRLNRELNALMNRTGLTAAAIDQVVCTGGTASLAAIARWLPQKFPNATTIIQDTYGGDRSSSPFNNCLSTCSRVAYGLAMLPLHPQVLDLSRQQYSPYFLLLELLRAFPDQPLSSGAVMQLLEQRGINTQACHQQVLALLEGQLPAGLVPSEHYAYLLTPDSAQNPDYRLLLSTPLFSKQGSQTYRLNYDQWNHFRRYLGTLMTSTYQKLAEPLAISLSL